MQILESDFTLIKSYLTHIRKLTLIEVVMKFLLAHVYIKELPPSSSLKPEACVQECEAQKNEP